VPAARVLLRFRLIAAVLSGFAPGCFQAAVASAPALKTETVISNDFTAGRSGWYNSAGSGGLGTSGDEAVHHLDGNALAINNTVALGLTYFPARTLAVGESLSISFMMSHAIVRNASGSLRFGVFGSAGSVKVSGHDFSSAPAGDFSAYRGYRVFLNPGSTAEAASSIARRDDANALLLDGDFSGIGSGKGVGLSSGTAYEVTFTLTRTGVSSLTTTFLLNGVVVTGLDEAATNFTFDTFAWKKSSETGNSGALYLDDFLVVKYSVVPEPSTVALWAGVLVVGFACARRGRRRRAGGNGE
jgi:hypothetical protein